MTGQLDRRAFLVLSALVLGGCATKQENAAEGKFPPWLIKVADPVAPAVGFTISHIQWRSGYLKKRSDALNHVRAHLQPLDILVFSSKGRLSGHTGSGLFGHSSVYLGTAVELKALGLSSAPEVVAHGEELDKGRSIVESAQKHGTDLSSLAYVGNTDCVAVLRPGGLSLPEKRAAIRRGFERVGRKFDHNFRLDTPEKLFCTELVDQVMPHLRLPRHKVYGREVIYPDDLVKMAVRGQRLSFVLAVTGSKDGWRKTSAHELLGAIAVAGG